MAQASAAAAAAAAARCSGAACGFDQAPALFGLKARCNMHANCNFTAIHPHDSPPALPRLPFSELRAAQGACWSCVRPCWLWAIGSLEGRAIAHWIPPPTTPPTTPNLRPAASPPVVNRHGVRVDHHHIVLQCNGSGRRVPFPPPRREHETPAKVRKPRFKLGAPGLHAGVREACKLAQ